MQFLILILDIILAIILLPFLIIRALLQRPKKEDLSCKKQSEYKIDIDGAVRNLSDCIKIKTISMTDETYPPKPFIEIKEFINKSYPVFFKKTELTIINNYSLIYRLKGKNPALKPICMLAHLDVVPAESEGWEVAPFSGEIKDGYIYGRGAQDMKGTLIAMLEALEYKLKEGYEPQRDLYFCFGHDEEPNTTNGALEIVKYFKSKNIEMESVFDEGGVMLDGGMLGIKNKTIAMIGTCEKGYVDVEVRTNVKGGHASNPNKKTAVAILAKTITEIVNTPMKARWTETVKETFKTISPHMSLLFKVLFVNRDILSPLLLFVLSKISITNALIRTTFAPTVLKGSDATNVLPRQAMTNINVRILNGETIQDVYDHMDKIAKKIDKATTIELIGGNNPTPIAETNTEAYKRISDTIKEVFSDTIPCPYPFIAGTDARYYYPVCKNIFRFTPFNFTMDDTTRIHALNERCKISDLEQAIIFFISYIENSCKE